MLPEAIAKKIEFTPDCWIWKGLLTKDGYGKVYVGGARHYAPAHRRVFELLVGPIPEGLTLDHLCRVRSCVNPQHLEPVTQGINTLRGDTFAARYARRTECSYGHPLSGENLHIRSNGARQCLTCARRWEETRQARLRAARPEKEQRTTCRRGHALDEENTYWHLGRRQCRACHRLRERKRKARLRLDRAAERHPHPTVVEAGPVTA
jgi:hypothetical protein